MKPKTTPASGLRVITNPPGQYAIAYRAGDQPAFLAALLARLAEGNQPPLRGLTSRTSGDFSLALLDAWAAVADVLSFYNERIASESYLATAQESRSLRWLARLIGYGPGPGLAARTHLAFTLDDSPGSPARVLIPPGTQAQSIPQEPPDEGGVMPQPQPFETLAPLAARPEWNRLRPRQNRHKPVGPGARSGWFRQPAAGSVSTGDMLFFRSGLQWAAARVTAAAVTDPPSGRVQITWAAPLNNRVLPVNAAVYVFRRRAAVFGHNAADWRSLPDAAKATYLGVPADKKLSAVELFEWPQFVIAGQDPGADPFRHAAFPPTPESIAEAARRAAEAAFRSALTDVITAVGRAALLIMKAITDAVGSLASFGNLLGGQSGSLQTQAGQFATDFQNSLFSFVSVFSPDISGLQTNFGFSWANLIGGLLNPAQFGQRIIDLIAGGLKPPALGDVTGLLNNITGPLLSMIQAPLNLLGQLGGSLGGLVQGVNDALNALLDVPKKLAAFVGAFLVSQSVLLAMKGILETPLPFPLTAQLVAFVALYAAKLPVAALAGLDPVNLINSLVATAHRPNQAQTTFQVLLTSLEQPGAASQVSSADLDAAATAAAGATTGLGLATIALAGPGLVSTAAVAVTGAVLAGAVSVAVLPYVLPVILGAIAIGAAASVAGAALVLARADLVAGAAAAEKAVRDAVIVALLSDMQLRRALPDILPDRIDLDAVYAAIAPLSWALLVLPEGKAAAYRVTDVAETGRNEFNLNGRVTRLTLQGAKFEILPEKDRANEDPFLRQVRRTTVYAQNEVLSPAGEPETELFPADQRRESLLLQGEIPVAGLEYGRPLSVEGVVGEIADKQRAPAGLVIGDTFAEVAAIATAGPYEACDAPGSPSCTRISLQKPLVCRYQRSTVTVYANVAEATHGETRRETLGSGDAAQAGQTFGLRGKPLTYIPAVNASGAASTLNVRVNGQSWQIAATPADLDPAERAFVVHTADDGTVTIQFGDGENGARLPSGQENVTAAYCAGAGRAGLVGPRRINLLTRFPPGVRSVTNPAAAVDGADPEDLALGRWAIPRPAVTIDRAVSLEDYVLLARGFAGVAKALATWTWDGQGRAIHITVAGDDGEDLTAQRLGELQTTLRHAGDPHVRLVPANGRQVKFVLRATLFVDREYVPDQVATAAETAVRARFAFSAREFGQPVTRLEVTTLLQGIRGVQAVDVDDLYRPDQAGQPGNPFALLRAAVPVGGRYGPAEPAELLLLGSLALVPRVWTD